MIRAMCTRRRHIWPAERLYYRHKGHDIGVYVGKLCVKGITVSPLTHVKNRALVPARSVPPAMRASGPRRDMAAFLFAAQPRMLALKRSTRRQTDEPRKRRPGGRSCSAAPPPPLLAEAPAAPHQPARDLALAQLGGERAALPGQAGSGVLRSAAQLP
ncbi:hypothetical protein D9M69_543760 [compost metagenome]